MPIPSVTNDCMLAHQLGMGLLYGLGLMVTLSKPQRSSSLMWNLLLVAAGYMSFGLWQSFTESASIAGGEQTIGSVWTSDSIFCRTWTFAGLVWLSQSCEKLRLNLVSGIDRCARFSIADLMAITTGVAFMIAALRYTTLIDRGPVFWLGMLAIAGVVPVVAITLRIECGASSWKNCGAAVVIAGMLVLVLAWAESSIVEQGKIDFAEAVSRYGCLIAAMMVPRLIEQSIAAAHGLGGKRVLRSIVDCDSRPALLADHFETQPDAHSDTPPMPRAYSRRADKTANRQAEPTLELIA